MIKICELNSHSMDLFMHLKRFITVKSFLASASVLGDLSLCVWVENLFDW